MFWNDVCPTKTHVTLIDQMLPYNQVQENYDDDDDDDDDEEEEEEEEEEI